MFAKFLGVVMKFCYELFNNYGLAIILFTILTKIVLLPLSILIQKDSIKMVKMQPKINRIKINYFGDKDRIAEETSKLYKEEHYNALTSLIPLVIQIILLFGVLEVVNHPLTHILSYDNKITGSLTEIVLKNNDKLDSESSSLEIEVVKDIQNNKDLSLYSDIDNKVIEEIKNLDLNFLGFNLSWVASVEKGIAFLIPIIAGLSALVLCIGQNKINVLQAEQSNYNKYGMLVLSVGLSLYLGTFVAAGVALYWTISNLVAVLQQIILNYFINPKKYVDYEELEKTNKELNELNNLNKSKGKRTKAQIKKEKQDYKRFFKIANKHLVFYSESNGFYKYFKGIIEYLLNNTNITVHYITSDYNDKIFGMEKENNQIKAYYIEEKKLITLMMKMDADVVVMTMPDLDNYHIKRSYVRKDVHYIFVGHGIGSLNLTYRTKALNAFDTVFTIGKDQYEEMKQIIKLYDLKDKTVVKQGYSLLDDMIDDYSKNKKTNKKKTILIAPSWQKDNIIDLCIDDILNSLKNLDYRIIVRPHPQHVRHMKEKFEQMKDFYKDYKNIEIQTDFSSNDSVFNADLLVTDWSGIGYEYAYTTKKPVLYIDTPMKVMNPDYKLIKYEPIDIWIRNKIGKSINVEEVSKIDLIVKELIKDSKKYEKDITNFTNEYIYNIGTSDKVGAEYIIELIQKKIKERRK